MWTELVKTPLFGIGLTLVVYLLAQTLYRRVNSVWANPVLVAIVAIILLLKAAGIDYRDYARGGDMILFLLGPSVVALAVPLYQRREEIWKRKKLILAGLFAGSLASVLSACGLAWLLGGLLLLQGGVAWASTLAEEKDQLRRHAMQDLVAELGLRESPVASRDLPGWREVKQVVARYPAERIDELRAVAPGVEIVAVENEAQALDAVADAQALIGFCTPDLLAKGDALHWVQVYSSGVERCVVLPQMRTGDKLLTNGQRIGSPALAEHAIAMMMALARGFDRYYVNQLEGDWQRQVDLGQGEFLELGGRTVLIVGLGGIGTQVARRAYGLGMRVIATRGSRREGPDYVEYVGLGDEALCLELDDLAVAQSDDPIRHLGDLRVVGDEEYAALTVDRCGAQLAEDLASGGNVEGTGRFIA